MKYNNLMNDNGVYLYKDNNFQTIYIQLAFLAKNGNKEDAIQSILCEYLISSNKKYDSDNAIKKKKRELYSIEVGFSSLFIGNKKLFYFFADMVSPNSVKNDYSKDAFEFIRDILFDPDFTNVEIFETIKRTHLSSIIHSFSDNEKFALRLYNDKVYDSIDSKYRFSTDIEYLSNMINSITLDDLKKAYDKIINEDSFYRGLVFGNITKEEFETFRKYIPYCSNQMTLDYSNKLKINTETIEISNESMNESIVYVTYTIDIPNKALYDILWNIFNSSSGLCDQVLRYKYGLVYYSYVQMNYYSKTMYFFAMIDKDNKQKLLDAIDEIINIVQNKEKIKEYLDNAKELIKWNYYTLSEDRDATFNKLDNYICGIYDNFNENEFANNVDSYSEDDIIKCGKSLKRKNVFMYRGL